MPKNKKKKPKNPPKKQTNKKKNPDTNYYYWQFFKDFYQNFSKQVYMANRQFIAQKNGIVLEISLSSNTTCQIFGE